MIQENGLLERDAQLAELLAAFEHVQTGEGKLVIVTGEAGVGKSALVEHFARLVADRCDFQTGLCEDLLSQRPLGAFDSVLTALELGQSAQHMDSASINLLFPSIVQKITRLANPLVWIIEDVHWADQVSLDLIRYVARRIHRIPLMVILTVRPEELAIHGRRAALMGDMPQRSITHIDVPLLSRSAVECLGFDD